jgi:integrase
VAIERWLNEATAKNARATRNRWLVTVRGLARWALRRRRLERDPTDTLERASVPEYLRPQFTVEEMRKCLDKDEWKVVRKGNSKRDPYHLLFAVLAYTGLRFQEAAHLRWEDIDWSGRVVMVRLAAGGRVKRQRERLVPLQSELAEILTPLRQESGHLFTGREWNPTRGFANFVKRAGVAVDGRSPHSLRHSYAGMMTATGVPGTLVGAYLGHTSAATTMIYTKLSTRYVASVASWPRGDLKLFNL